MSKSVLCIGEVLIDAISIENSNNLENVNTFEITVGGSVANFCTYLKKLNVPSNLIASIGSDGFGRKILTHLKSNEIDSSLISILERHNTSLVTVTKTSNTPDFLAYRDADKQITHIDDRAFEQSVLIHSNAFCLSKNPAQETIMNCFEKAVQKGKLISCDWNYAPRIWENVESAQQVFQKLQTFEPLLKFSLDDVIRFVGKEISEIDAIKYLEHVQAKVICLTCGSKGVYFKNKESDWQFLEVPKIKVINATGAGDSFWAGFISSFLQSKNINDCVVDGINTATKKLQNLI